MLRSRVLRRVVLLGLSAALVAGCGHDDEAAAPEDVLYGGEATDEAWLTIDEAPLVTDDASAPRLTAPTSLSRGGAPPELAWEPGAVALRSNGPAPARRFASRRRRAQGALAELFGAPTARAHEPPVTGAVYRLVLSLGAADPVRVLTTETRWTPDASSWSRIAAATGSVQVELVGAYLMSGRVTEGPFVASQPATLSFAE